MNRLARYIIIVVSIAAIAFLLWYFSDIVWYIVVSAVLSLIGKPIVRACSRIRIGRWHCPKALGATVALLTIFLAFGLFFYSMIPLLTSQFNSLQNVDMEAFSESFAVPLAKLDASFSRFLPKSLYDFSIQKEINEQINNLFNVTFFKRIFTSTASFITDLFIFLFAVAFITFFFLKDEGLMMRGVSTFFPIKYHEHLQRAMSSVEKLLRRYFIGIVLESVLVMILTAVGLIILRLPVGTSIVIALLSGILNVVPYVGALFALGINLIIPMAMYMNGGSFFPLDMLLLLIVVVFLVVRLLDNMFLQPYIYASSANAHPLEIFIVLLMAGSLSGMLGMLLAVPVYTVVRVFAKEFFNNFAIVQRLTKNM